MARRRRKIEDIKNMQLPTPIVCEMPCCTNPVCCYNEFVCLHVCVVHQESRKEDLRQVRIKLSFPQRSAWAKRTCHILARDIDRSLAIMYRVEEERDKELQGIEDEDMLQMELDCCDSNSQRIVHLGSIT